MKNKKIGIIGCGNMGEALINQAKSAKRKAQNFIFSEKDKKRIEFIEKKYNLAGFRDNKELLKQADVIILAVKPQDINNILSEIRNSKLEIKKKIFISIVAGITTKHIEDMIGIEPRVIRVMPNLPCTIKKGVSAVCLGSYAKETDFKIAEKIFSNIGVVVKVSEDKINAITAVSGSGPAYFYYFIEALFEGALELGLGVDLAGQLILETAAGSIELLKERRECPKDLRKKITSKSGTTEAAISILNINEVKDTIKNALLLAKKRAEILSELISLAH
ncbi:MAG: pyrroline-5-carboxylate reductase [Candidatus Omnitrophota bacterium]